jgi:hypothetical protein
MEKHMPMFSLTGMTPPTSKSEELLYRERRTQMAMGFTLAVAGLALPPLLKAFAWAPNTPNPVSGMVPQAVLRLAP